jgi:hypothetical protein
MKHWVVSSAAALYIGTVGYLWMDHGFVTLALRDAHESGARRLALAASESIAHAHAANDDLALQSAIGALGRTPGVLFAAIVDKEGKILAHSDPSRLGQPAQRPGRTRESSDHWSFTLRDAEGAWASLRLGLADRSVVAAVRRHAVRTGGATLGVTVLLGGLAWLWRRRERALTQIADDAGLRAEKSERLLADHLGRMTAERELYAGWLAQALDRLPYPAMVFDGRQRIAACNGPARALLLGGLEDPVGRFWHEVPALGSFASVFDQSLNTPGQPITYPLEDHGAVHVESTQKNGVSGTWVWIVADEPSDIIPACSSAPRSSSPLSSSRFA